MVTAFTVILFFYALSVVKDSYNDYNMWMGDTRDSEPDTIVVSPTIKFLDPEWEEVTADILAGISLTYRTPQVVEEEVLNYLVEYYKRPDPIDWGMELWEQFAHGLIDAEAFCPIRGKMTQSAILSV